MTEASTLVCLLLAMTLKMIPYSLVMSVLNYFC